MLCKIKSYIEKYGLLTDERLVIVGFSGGMDSVSLLDILHRLGYRCVAAHCNFHLREDESNRDEAFCRKIAGQQELTFEKVDFDTSAYAAKQHVSIEMAARELRYKWLESLREKYDAQAIAVAHHRDDSNETILLNLIRGTGLRGLCGIRPKNGWIIRPLLEVGKEDIDRYVKEQSLSFVTDSSNQMDICTRNIIRLHLLPLMKEINPAIETTLVRTAEQLTDVEKIYLQTIENAKKTLLKKNEENVLTLSINDLLDFPSPQTILYELLRPYGFKRQQAAAIFQALQSEPGKQFDAPDGDYQLLKDRTSLLIYKKPAAETAMYPIEENDSDLSFLPITLSIQKIEINRSFEVETSPSTASFDYEKIDFPLYVRKWRQGDWFVPFGMKGRKKLSDYFTDSKFNLLQKQNIWLLCSGKDIIWIIGHRIDNRYKIDSHTKNALVINFFSKYHCNK